MACHPVYEQIPLSLTGHEIRLIEVLHVNRKDGSDIRLKFHHRTISPQLKYYALSYAWGSQSNQHNITVDDETIPIRENLWHFFWQSQIHLEDGQMVEWVNGKPRSLPLLWIDALCIDQTNVLERNHQVALMGKIYENVCLLLQKGFRGTWLIST